MIIYTQKDDIEQQQVNIFLAEKDISVKSISIDRRQHERLVHPILSQNQQPILKLEDGTIILGAIAICRYFEQSLTLNKPLFGQTATEQARVEMWLRIIESQGLTELKELTAINMLPAVRLQAIRRQFIVLFGILEKHLAGRAYMIGNHLSIVDITAYTAIIYAEQLGIEMIYDFPYLLALKTRLSLNTAFSKS